MKIVSLTIFRGTTFGPISIKCTKPDKSAFNLTGYLPFSQVRADPDDQQAVLDLNPSITDAAAGIITIPKISKEATNLLSEGDFQWDCVLQAPSGDRLPPVIGGAFAIKSINTH